MRLKRSRIQKFYFKKREVKKDSEGGVYEEYGTALAFYGEAWPAGGKIQAELYGERLNYIYNVKVEGKYQIVKDEQDKVPHYVFPELGLDLCEGDCICLFVQSADIPDYRIISIKPYRFIRLEVEKI